MYTLKFKKSVYKDLKKIGFENSKKILNKIRSDLLKDPRKGKPLRGQDGIIWTYRVGDYRILYLFDDNELILLVVRIGHRKEVYKQL